MTSARIALRNRLARRQLERQLRSPHYQAALASGADLRRERSAAIRRAERWSLISLILATIASLIATIVTVLVVVQAIANGAPR